MSKEGPIRVMLVDDHALLRGTLTHRLNAEEDIRVVASLGSADEAVSQAVQRLPDVILMDIDMPGVSCFQTTRTLGIRCPSARVVLLSAFHNDRYIEQAIDAKCWGYIVKTEPEEAVIAAIRSVAGGIAYYSSEIRERMVIDGRGTRLTPEASSRASWLSKREVEVLRYAARGLTYEQIGKAISISKHTVHRHVVKIMQKLDIHDRVALARYAIREGLAEP